ncbi:MAG: acyl-CoA dehydratase activase, partial [Bacillota bacterium]
EYAYHYVRDTYSDIDAIVSAGGETCLVYQLDPRGKIINVFAGNKCASGTGEFFLQQVKRMDVTVNQAVKLADTSHLYKVAGRCSVFCKSDCTHALNKGEPKGRVVAGLCKMMSNKIVELVKNCSGQKVLLVGGTALNQVMVGFLRDELPLVEVPVEAPYFEALGAAIWAAENKQVQLPGALFGEKSSSFTFLPPIKDAASQVVFKEGNFSSSRSGDRCIVGLDVGSTTTKAIVLRVEDNAILAHVYLRTGGDPVRASQQCYQELEGQIKSPIKIIGLGVTGSGRQIAGLHGLTEGVINEIIAHATAAVYFDPEVDTIFEIGGQDAKYTSITNRVPCDYAMNEACSAGTGSFLEEAAKESLDIDTLGIAPMAIRSEHPPNFSDQCAAFISSDIKNAIQEGISAEDILGGLVYSICMNYINRVKGARPVGRKVFMQGGVCYNQAVPMAMAALTGQTIIVPPQPGLMGAFGVALEIKNKLDLGLLEEKEFILAELGGREVEYGKKFTCTGRKENCDRKCTINMLHIAGKNYPFGGACNKYVNQVYRNSRVGEGLDLVTLRERLVFEKYAPAQVPEQGPLVGINRSLLTNTYYPLYANFFTSLGCRVVVSGESTVTGTERKGAAFCYPAELAHGFIHDLLTREPDVIFLPHVKSIAVLNGIEASVTCPFVQGEPYYLKAAFPELAQKRVLTPVLDISGSMKAVERQFIAIGRELGFSREVAVRAFDQAMAVQQSFLNELKDIGQKYLAELEQHPERRAVVLFGRPYNAYTGVANMGIPRKFSSRGWAVIPADFLPLDQEEPVKQMYWAIGQTMMQAAAFVRRHPQLFGAYITNFSCGPDSFLIGYFRDRMGEKPSLTLELDNHTADAGLDTRVEAFLDIIQSYIRLQPSQQQKKDQPFRAARTVYQNEQFWVEDSNGTHLEITDPQVKVLIPSMGDFAARSLAAALRFFDVDAEALPPPGEQELKAGKNHTTCKECLPLMLTLGSLQTYLSRREGEEVLVYFMPKTSGPCRFGQYNVLIENVIRKLRLDNVAVMSLSSANSYAGLPLSFQQRAWYAVMIADVMEDVRNAILTLGMDREKDLRVYEQVEKIIEQALEKEKWSGLKDALRTGASMLASIPLSQRLEEAGKVLLVGEIYVRKDGYSRQYLEEKLARKGLVMKTSPISEWLYYCDYALRHDFSGQQNPASVKARTYLKELWKHRAEMEIKHIMAKSNLYEPHPINIAALINNTRELFSQSLTGEAILTIGSGLSEIVDEVDGVIAIGPFGCMPNRMAEAVLSKTLNKAKPSATSKRQLTKMLLQKHPSLPFLSIETDGNVFPQLVEAKLEAFCVQVKRVHQLIKELS